MGTWPADKVERWQIERLVPYVRNARTHSEAQISQIVASMREWGWTNPILIDDQGGIIAGHGRVLAARQLGWTEVPVMVATGWSEPQKEAHVLADNKLALNAGWDSELLVLELGDLKALGADLGLTGFAEAELQSLLAEPRTGLTDVDAVPDARESSTSRPGDLWLLGPHRLLCGDSTSADNWLQLVHEQADLIFTDPPYGMAYGGGRAAGSTSRGARVKAHGMIANDDLHGEALVALVRGRARRGDYAMQSWSWPLRLPDLAKLCRIRNGAAVRGPRREGRTPSGTKPRSDWAVATTALSTSLSCTAAEPGSVTRHKAMCGR